MPPKDLPAGAKKIYVAAEANARKSTCKDREDKDACVNKIAWSAVKNKYKKVGDKWTPKAEVASFSMAITKTSYDKRTNTRRWKAVASDIKDDLYNDNMTLELYEDFLRRIEIEELPPESFRSDFWDGGMPYLSISHYSDLNGKGVPGPIDTVYVDGKELKSTGRFDDTPLGKKCFQAISKDLDTKSATPDNEKVRISIGFLDWKHKHKSNEFVFDRAESEDVMCPECLKEMIEGMMEDKEPKGKEFLRGHLVHEALTRVPVNIRTKMEVKSMTTQKEDAESIIEELAEELEEEAKIIDKSEVSDNDPEIVVKSDDDKPLVEEAKQDKKKKDDEEEDGEDDEKKKKKMKEKKADIVEEIPSTVNADVLKAIEELRAEITQESAPSHLLDIAFAELKSVYDEAVELPDPQEALQMIQEPFEALMIVIQNSVAKSELEEEVEVTEDGEVAKAIASLAQELGLLRAEVSTMKSQPQNVLPEQPEVPVRRSIGPSLLRQPVTETQSSTPKLHEIVKRSVHVQ